MVTAIISKFIGKLKKEPNEKVASRAPGSTTTTQGNRSGIDTAKIDLVAFVDFVTRSLVEHPEEVTIETGQSDNGITMKVSCKKDEVRKIIGRNGKTINAIRALVKGAAKRISQNVTIVVID